MSSDESDDGGPASSTAEAGAAGSPAPDEMYCSNCGSVIDADAEICPDCGVRQQSATDEKNAAVSFVASLVVPGAGQVYNDQVGRGIAMFVGTAVMDLVIVFVAGILTFIVIGPLFLLLIPVVHVAVAYDAYTQAEKINDGTITP
ncbi:zinc ribbon domain-containing protein [Haloplanus halophilus]|uniref:zinc ribbon domain-containing protein n=1 Tax=Haloplanus halophilus TaxID=2949993 RepID=UPI00203FCE4C|nr:zinc ribbon domain-containing protein [Haloplanus sp. GDY1]